MTANRIRVPVPAETGGEDRLAGSLTFRHAAYLAAAAAGVAVMLLGEPSVARVGVGAVLAVVGVLGALCRPYGEPLDRLAPAAVAYLVRRRGERTQAEPVTVEDDVAADEVIAPSAPEPASTASERRESMRPNPVVVRRAAGAVAVLGVVALGASRLADRPTPPPPAPSVVVVQVPVLPDPWEEVDDALDTWFDDAVAG